MAVLTVSDAQRIAEDLNNDKSIKRHVDKLMKLIVTTDLLREVELEEALARHAWHKKYADLVQALLMKYFRMLRVEDEARAKEAELLKQKEGTNDEAQIQQELPKKEEPKNPLEIENKKQAEREKPLENVKPVKKTKPVPEQPQNLFPLPGEVASLRLVTNVARNDGIKRKHNSNSHGEPMSKKTKKDEKKSKKEDKEGAKSEKKEKTATKEAVKPEEEEKESKNLVEIESDPIKQLVTKIEKVPRKITPNEIEIFLKGVAVSDLVAAEKTLGRTMKRLDRVWWFLLERDFKIARDGSSSDPRTKYFKQSRKSIQENVKPQNTVPEAATMSVEEEYLAF